MGPRSGRGVSPGFPALSATTLALAVWWIATTLTARHLPTALFDDGRYNGLTTMLAGLALFITIASTRMAPREVEQRLGAICVALAAASVYALVQALGFDVIQWPEGRPPSTLGHPVILGGVLAMALPFSVAFVLDGRSPASRRAWGAVTVVQGLALALTLARGAWAWRSRRPLRFFDPRCPAAAGARLAARRRGGLRRPRRNDRSGRFGADAHPALSVFPRSRA